MGSNKGWQGHEAILDSVPIPVFSVDKDFSLVFANKAAAGVVGRSMPDLIGQNCGEIFRADICGGADCPVDKILKFGGEASGVTNLRIGEKRVPYLFFAAPVYDSGGELAGAVEVMVESSEVNRMQGIITRLREDLMELSTPVLSLWRDVLAMPLIGTLDSLRVQEAMEKALDAIADQKAKVLILDITGVPLVDTQVAHHLIRLATAVQLMGGMSIITGIRPETAKTIVHLGIDLSRFNTCSTLAQGLEMAIAQVDPKTGA